MDQEKKMEQFLQWLPENISKFKEAIPEETLKGIAGASSLEEVVEELNDLSKSSQGGKLIEELYKVFEEDSRMFKPGGKLSYLLGKFQDPAASLPESTNNRAAQGSLGKTNNPSKYTN